MDLLSQQFDSPEKLATEIINLEPALGLPKGTEHFVSDLHGEYKSFQHVLGNGSGNVRAKINDIFLGNIFQKGIDDLAVLVYYPEEKLKLTKNDFNSKRELNEWYILTIECLIDSITYCSSRYICSKLRKASPSGYTYIIEELLYKNNEFNNKKLYYETLLSQVVESEQSDDSIIRLSYTIQRLVVDHLHVVGDIYGRGPEPDKIMDTLIGYHSVDIQWGNHDVLRTGAYTGSKVCLANLLRICARYDSLDIIEDACGINLRPLLTLAERHYDGDNPAFRPKKRPDKKVGLSKHEEAQTIKIHQAIAMIQFKLETPIIKCRPSLEMDDRLVLEKTNYDTNEITTHGKAYPSKDTCLSTVDPKGLAKLLPEEEDVVNKLLLSFQRSEKLKRHIALLMRKGKLYLPYNGNLLIHGCIPVDDNGEMEFFEIEGVKHKGRDLLDVFEHHVCLVFSDKEKIDDLSTDLVWYLWTGKYSSLFGKRAMIIFERYLIEDKASHKEPKNPYYYLREDADMIRKVLEDFGLNPDEDRIISGHTPVREIGDEDPIKANGKMLVIDGGFSKAYQSTTGIAGYALSYNSFGMQLVAHQFSDPKKNVSFDGADEPLVRRVIDEELQRKKIRDTNVGKDIMEQIRALRLLMHDRYLK